MNTGDKGGEGSFQGKPHVMGFIGSADEIIFSIEPGVLDNYQVFGCGNCWDCPGVVWVVGGRV